MGTGADATGDPVRALDELVPDWLPLPEVAERLGVTPSRVRQLVRARELVAVRRTSPGELEVPGRFLDGDRVLKGLAGTLTQLADAGFEPAESIRWLFTEDRALGAAPVAALAAGRTTDVHRQAQLLG